MIILNKLSAPYEQCHWLILHEVSVPVSQMFGCWAGAKDDQGGKLKTPCVSLNLVSCYSDLLSYLCCVGAFVSVLSKAEMVSSANHQAETTGQRPRIHSEGRCTRSDTVTGSPVSRSGECLCIDTYIIMLVHPKIQFFFIIHLLILMLCKTCIMLFSVWSTRYFEVFLSLCKDLSPPQFYCK